MYATKKENGKFQFLLSNNHIDKSKYRGSLMQKLIIKSIRDTNIYGVKGYVSIAGSVKKHTDTKCSDLDLIIHSTDHVKPSRKNRVALKEALLTNDTKRLIKRIQLKNRATKIIFHNGLQVDLVPERCTWKSDDLKLDQKLFFVDNRKAQLVAKALKLYFKWKKIKVKGFVIERIFQMLFHRVEKYNEFNQFLNILRILSELQRGSGDYRLVGDEIRRQYYDVDSQSTHRSEETFPCHDCVTTASVRRQVNRIIYHATRTTAKMISFKKEFLLHLQSMLEE